MRTLLLFACLGLAGCAAVTDQTVGVTLLPPPASAVLAVQDGVSLVMEGAAELERQQPTYHAPRPRPFWCTSGASMTGPEGVATRQYVAQHPEQCSDDAPWYRSLLNVVLLPVIIADMGFSVASALAGTLILGVTTPFAMLTTCRGEIVHGPPFSEGSHCVQDFPITGYIGTALLQRLCRFEDRLGVLSGNPDNKPCPWDPGYAPPGPPPRYPMYRVSCDLEPTACHELPHEDVRFSYVWIESETCRLLRLDRPDGTSVRLGEASPSIGSPPSRSTARRPVCGRIALD